MSIVRLFSFAFALRLVVLPQFRELAFHELVRSRRLIELTVARLLRSLASFSRRCRVDGVVLDHDRLSVARLLLDGENKVEFGEEEGEEWCGDGEGGREDDAEVSQTHLGRVGVLSDKAKVGEAARGGIGERRKTSMKGSNVQEAEEGVLLNRELSNELAECVDTVAAVAKIWRTGEERSVKGRGKDGGERKGETREEDEPMTRKNSL